MNENKIIRTMIVDDEPLGREAVRRLLSGVNDFEVIAECSGGEQAVREIPALNPDVVFLDIQMPQCDGFGVVAQLKESMPLTVFVTAYDEHALSAFESYALDYVLKPVDPLRFQKSLNRVRDRVREQEGAVYSISSLLDAIAGRHSLSGRLAFKCRGRLILLSPDELQWVDAAGNYVKLHTSEGEYLVRESIGKIAERLDQNQFARIHRSTIINISSLREIRPSASSGEYLVVLRDGTELALGRAYRSDFERLLKLYN